MISAMKETSQKVFRWVYCEKECFVSVGVALNRRRVDSKSRSAVKSGQLARVKWFDTNQRVVTSVIDVGQVSVEK
jgi:hypothetical protein